MGAAPQPGRILEHYRLLQKLGEGGMGAVWLAEDTRLGRKVAIKFLPTGAARDVARRQRFEQEARAAAALVHPGIAAVHALEQAQDEIYIVFEYVPGHTLRALVVPGGMASGALLDIACEIAEALAAAHAAGIVHRDLKPENVMRTPAGVCKVLDFGLARMGAQGLARLGGAQPETETATLTHLTSAGVVVGTVAYMSPEQLEGKEVDFRSDVFSFGTLLYELATGAHPFAGASSASIIAAVLTAEPPPLTQRNPLHPAELDRIVRKCLRKRRDDRYQSTDDLAVDLRELKRVSESGANLALAPPPAEEEEENLFNTTLRRFLPTPRRWWELTTLKMLIVHVPAAIYLAWRVRQVALTGWAPAAFLAMAALCTVHGSLRAIMIVTAAMAPRELPSRVRSFQPWLSWIAYAQGAVCVLLALMLGFDRYPLGAPLIVGLGAGFIIWGVTEPMLARRAFPQAFVALPTKPAGAANRT